MVEERKEIKFCPIDGSKIELKDLVRGCSFEKCKVCVSLYGQKFIS